MENEKLDKVNQEIERKKGKEKEYVRDIVTMTLWKKEKLEKLRADIQEQIKILQHDLFDIKDGRLDRIMERQEMSAIAKETSVMSVSMLSVNGNNSKQSNPWYINYEVKYSINDKPIIVFLNNSVMRLSASGSYKMEDGSVKYF